MAKLSIVVIGAGMGGLATAVALRRVGVDAQIYEQTAKFARLGAGIQIGCNAMKVLREFGLVPLSQKMSQKVAGAAVRESGSGAIPK
jgi:6-hydroxynicotinate 3-monooxygenase